MSGPLAGLREPDATGSQVKDAAGLTWVRYTSDPQAPAPWVTWKAGSTVVDSWPHIDVVCITDNVGIIPAGRRRRRLRTVKP